jgi:hypothetical protein
MHARLAIEAEFAPDGPRLRRKRRTVVAPVSQGSIEFTVNAEYAYDYGMTNKFSHFRFWYCDAPFEDVREMQLEARTLSRPCLERGGLPVASVTKETKEPVEA